MEVVVDYKLYTMYNIYWEILSYNIFRVPHFKYFYN